jgi:hypothetical protein
MLRQPTLEDLRKLSEEYRLNATDEELNIFAGRQYNNNNKMPDNFDNVKIFAGAIAHDSESLKIMNAWENPLHIEMHKNKGQEFHRAKPEENPYNAW